MPKNTPLPMQWLTVDGQNVPIVLPDHWDDDKKEWKTTGTGNPLPVANYTQNASGVWLPTSKDNPVPTQLTGSNVEYEQAIPVKRIESNIEVIREAIPIEKLKAGETVLLTIEPPKGYVYDLLSLSFDFRGSQGLSVFCGIDSTAAASDRFLEVRAGESNAYAQVLSNSLVSGDLIIPREPAEIFDVVKNVMISPQSKLVIRVSNENQSSTDLNVALIRITYKKIKVVEYDE